MSLQVWLPLNNNLINKGLTNPSITTSGTIEYVNGGRTQTKCLKLGSAYVKIPYSYWSTKQLTIALWIDPNSPDIWSDIFSFGDNERLEKSNTNIYYWYSTNNKFINGGTPIFSSLSNDTWHHIVMTVNDKTVKFYLNGSYVCTKTANNDITNTASINSFFVLGGRTKLSNGYSGYANDFRIYDHCLSESEIKELAKGLVAHYRLCGPKVGNPNLCTALLTAGNRVSVTGQTYSYDSKTNILTATVTDISGSSSGGFHNGLGFSKTEDKSNKKYTWSCWMKASRNMTLGTVGSETNGCRSCNVTTSWQLFTHTWTYNYSSTYSSNVWYNPSGGWKVGDVLYVKDFKIEEGEIATAFVPPSGITKYTSMGYNSLVEEDCSGYGNKGTQAKTFSYDTNTPMNNSCYVFNSDAQYINIGKSSILSSAITISLWAYMTDWTKFDSRLFSCTEAGGWNIEKDGSTARMSSLIYINGAYSKIYKNLSEISSGWHLFTVTYDGLNHKFYIDTTLIGTNTTSTSYNITYNSNSNVYLGGESNGTSVTGPYFSAGKMSDYRCYATALTLEQIQELYSKNHLS